MNLPRMSNGSIWTCSIPWLIPVGALGGQSSDEPPAFVLLLELGDELDRQTEDIKKLAYDVSTKLKSNA